MNEVLDSLKFIQYYIASRTKSVLFCKLFRCSVPFGDNSCLVGDLPGSWGET